MTVPVIPLPAPAAPAPSLRWGIVGVGNIAGRFVDALARRSAQRTTAVASRSRGRAESFAKAHGVPNAMSSVDDLVARDDVDVVYIATPHQSHRQVAESALNAGKHVLIEKPLAHTAADASAITRLARDRGLLAMEAMWTRYLPQMEMMRELLRQGTIGEVAHVEAAFGFAAPFDPKHRLWSPELAGGALLDAGVYPVSFISSVLGAPEEMTAFGTIASTGVDDHSHLSLSYSTATAAATSSLRVPLTSRAIIAGTAGRIEFDSPFFMPSGLTLSTSSHWKPDPDAAHWTDTAFGEPYDALHYEADALARFVDEARVESPLHTHAETVAIIDLIERARTQLGAI